MTILYETIKDLLYDANNIGYGIMLSRCKKIETTKIPTAGVKLSEHGVELYYNKKFFMGLSKKAKKELLIHEMNHIGHCHLLEQVDVKTAQANNLAMDCAIWHENKTLTQEVGGISPDILKKDPYLTWKDYLQEAKNMSEKQQQELKDALDSHAMWGESELTEAEKKAAVKDLFRSMREAGNVPNSMKESVDKLFEVKFDWKSKLNNFFLNSIKASKRKTRKRANRRFGLAQQGKLTKRKSRIGIIVDNSGSISNEEATLFFSHIMKIKKSMDCDIEIMIADTEVSDHYKFERIPDIKFSRGGGTDFTIPINYANEQGFDGIVYFTDGYGEMNTKPNCPLLWAFTKNHNIPSKIGKRVVIEEV